MVLWLVLNQDEDFASLASTEPAESETSTSETDNKVSVQILVDDLYDWLS